MGKYYLAIDIGASSGRHILAHKEDGKIVLEEVYRFPNGMVDNNGELVWEADRISSPWGSLPAAIRSAAVASMP